MSNLVQALRVQKIRLNEGIIKINDVIIIIQRMCIHAYIDDPEKPKTHVICANCDRTEPRIGVVKE